MLKRVNEIYLKALEKNKNDECKKDCPFRYEPCPCSAEIAQEAINEAKGGSADE